MANCIRLITDATTKQRLKQMAQAIREATNTDLKQAWGQAANNLLAEYEAALQEAIAHVTAQHEERNQRLGKTKPVAQKPETTPEPEAKQGGAVAKPAAKKTGIVNDSDDILAAIAKLGGLNRDEAKAQGIDPKAFDTRGYGIKRVFTKAGRSYDEMAELLRGYHFDVPMANDLVESVSRAINQGEKIYNPAGYERIAEIKAQERYDDEQAQLHAQLDDAIESGDIEVTDLEDALYDLDDLGIKETFTGNEAIKALNDYFGIDDEQEAIETSAAKPDTEVLESYTEQELADREAAEKQRLKQAQDEEVKAKQKEQADKERDSLVDEMLGTAPKTNDVFGMSDPLENINKPNKTVAPISKNDIPYDKAYDAYRGISFDPDKRAKSIQDEYVSYMQSVYDGVIKIAKTDEQREIINSAFIDYKQGYIKKQLAHLVAMSRVISPMITGPANFPVRRNEKANNVEHKRLEEFIEWDKKARVRLQFIANGVRSDEEIADERFSKIKKKIANSLSTIKGIDNGTEKGYSRQLFVNSVTGIIKTLARNGEVDLVNKSLDFIQDYQKDLKKALITRANGVWQLRNQAAEVSETNEQKTGTETIKSYQGALVVNNLDAERVQILFDEKPSSEIRAALKKNAFKWSPSNNAWQRQNTPNGIASSKRVLDGLFEVKKTEAITKPTDAKFSFASERAKTADKYQLSTAQQRLDAGEDAETVRQETGWHKGADGKWRFEISDDQASLMSAIKSLGVRHESKTINAVTYKQNDDGTYELVLVPNNPQKVTDLVTLHGVSRHVVNGVLPESIVKQIDANQGEDDYIGDFEEAKRIKETFYFDGFNALPLSEVLNHKQLFAAYPSLKDMMVQVDKGLGGSFVLMDNGEYVIRIGEARQLSTLLHEIQHAIQTIEGFASGGNPEQFENSYAMNSRIAEYHRKKFNELRKSVQQTDEYKNLSEQRDEAIKNGDKEAVVELSDKIGKLIDKTGANDHYKIWKQTEAQVIDPQTTYRRLAGEAEARNTQARQGMTAEERKATSPESTQDVKNSDVIVMFNGKVMNNATTPENANINNTSRSTVAEIKSLLPRRVKRLVESGKLIVVQSINEVDPDAEAFDAGSVEGFYNGRTDEIYLIADSITPETLPSTLKHELFHRMLATDKNLKAAFLIFKKYLQKRFDLAAKGFGSAIEKEAYNRVINAGTPMADQVEEFAAYLVSAYNRAPESFTGVIKKIIQDFIAAIRVAMLRVGIPLSQLTPADLNALAMYGARVRNDSFNARNGKPLQSFAGEKIQETILIDGKERPTRNSNGQLIHPTEEGIRNFWKWFGDSKVVDEQGRPLVVYHGTGIDFSEFKPSESGAFGKGVYLADTPQEAQRWARNGDRSVMPVYARIENPYYWEDSNDGFRHPDNVNKDARDDGYDSIMRVWGDDTKEIVAFNPSQIKSAIGNTGAFSPDTDNIKFSRSSDNDNNDLAEFKRRAGLGPKKTLVDTIQEVLSRGLDANVQALKDKWEAVKPSLEQGIFDKFLGIKLAEQEILGDVAHSISGYVGARLSTGSSSTMSAVLQYGAPEWRGGIIQRKDGTKGFADILQPVKDDLENFAAWMVARRADRLFQEGREHNFSREMIDAGLALKKDHYQGVADDIAALNSSVLDLAQDAGLIDSESRRLWESADYIPFYRLIEGKKSAGPRSRQGLTHQSSGIRMLRGGENPMSDPLGNMMQNWAHLIDASMKNKALDKTLTNLDNSHFITKVPRVQFHQALIPKEQIKKLMLESGLPEDIVEAMPEDLTQGIAKLWSLQAPTDPDIVRVMRDGKSEYYRVNDAMLLTSLTAINQSPLSGLFKPMRYMKSLLTGAVTADPTFMARNFIRDSMHSWTIAEEAGFRFGVDSIKGAIKSFKEEGSYVDMMFAGASFQGGYGNYNNPEAARSAMDSVLRKKGITNPQGFLETVIDTPRKYWGMYRAIGDAIENANRDAILENAKQAGAEKAQYLFEAKDIMDFSMQGSFTIVRAMSDMLPFFNARLIGLYRLAKAGKTEEARAMIIKKGATIALFSLALLALNGDNDDYEELEDWDKDQYWHIFVGGEHYRIPKPFELGLVFGTIPERSARMLLGNDTLKEFAARMGHGASDTLAFNPVPQLFRPFLELYANKDMFTGRSIEGMSDEGKLPSARYNAYTSDTMRALSEVLPESLGASPKRLEHLVHGYTGAMGMYILGASDMLVRDMQGAPESPALRMDRVPVLKAFYQEKPNLHTIYGTQFYDMLKEVEQVQRTITAYTKEGMAEEARQLLSENASQLSARKLLNRTNKTLIELRHQVDAVYRSNLSASEKRRRIDALMERSNSVTRRVVQQTHPFFK